MHCMPIVLSGNRSRLVLHFEKSKMATKIGREKRASKKPETPRLVKTKAQFDFLKKLRTIILFWDCE